jgi:hypothetical protein
MLINRYEVGNQGAQIVWKQPEVYTCLRGKSYKNMKQVG